MTETLRLAFGLDIQSFVIIGCITMFSVALGFFIFKYLIPYVTLSINERKKTVHQDNIKRSEKETIKQTMTIEEMNEKLTLLQLEGTFKRAVTLLGQIMPDFQRYLKTRPFDNSEANDYYLVYLQIFNLCLNIIPLESKVDYKSFAKKYKEELKQITKRFREIASYEWLQEMDVCLLTIYRYITEKQTETIDLRIVQYLLNNNQDLIIDRVDDKTFYHLSAEDYNKFGVELRGEFFKRNFFTEKKDDSEYYY
ncbi:MAG: hypothetical protein ACTSQK_03915 [Candidatus Heimdallarchaeota archaeon]